MQVKYDMERISEVAQFIKESASKCREEQHKIRMAYETMIATQLSGSQADSFAEEYNQLDKLLDRCLQEFESLAQTMNTHTARADSLQNKSERLM